jgi:hypothetical protein
VWPWLATIAINVCTDMERRDSRIAFMAEPPDGAATTDVAADVDGRTRRGIVRAALASLPLPYRRSVFLHHYAGLSYDEIAEHEGTTAGAVRSRLLRARRLLRVRIEEAATARGDWPLPTAAPWLRERVAGVRLVISQVDAAVGQNVGSAAQYAAALLFAIGVGGVGGVADAAGTHAAPTAIAAEAGTHLIGTGTKADVLARAVPAEAGRVSNGAAPSMPPVPRVKPELLKQTLTSPVPVKEGDDQRLLVVGWGCEGATEPGPVTKKLCETFPNGITPP